MSKETGNKPKKRHKDSYPNDVRTSDTPVKCEKCSFLLGFLDLKEQNVFRMKYRDFFVKVIGAEVIETPCRRCGEFTFLNFTVTEDEIFPVAEKVSGAG